MAGKNLKDRIMVFGTFDGVHKGHLNFFEQAKNLSKEAFLVVSIARDKNVFKIKGEYPRKNEKARMDLVGKIKLVDKVVLSGAQDHLPHILRARPNIIALGYDQKAYIKNLKKDLEAKGLSIKIIRLKPFQEKIYKNHLLRSIDKNLF